MEAIQLTKFYLKKQETSFMDISTSEKAMLNQESIPCPSMLTEIVTATDMENANQAKDVVLKASMRYDEVS